MIVRDPSAPDPLCPTSVGLAGKDFLVHCCRTVCVKGVMMANWRVRDPTTAPVESVMGDDSTPCPAQSCAARTLSFPIWFVLVESSMCTLVREEMLKSL